MKIVLNTVNKTPSNLTGKTHRQNHSSGLSFRLELSLSWRNKMVKRGSRPQEIHPERLTWNGTWEYGPPWKKENHLPHLENVMWIFPGWGGVIFKGVNITWKTGGILAKNEHLKHLGVMFFSPQKGTTKTLRLPSNLEKNQIKWKTVHSNSMQNDQNNPQKRSCVSFSIIAIHPKHFWWFRNPRLDLVY